MDLDQQVFRRNVAPDEDGIIEVRHNLGTYSPVIRCLRADGGEVLAFWNAVSEEAVEVLLPAGSEVSCVEANTEDQEGGTK